MRIPSVAEVQAVLADRFAVDELYARGGMGAVFIGRHRALGSAVAIKVLSLTGDVEPSTEELARFRREARLAAQLSHPHIVPVFELDARGDLAYLVMPFIQGRTLEEILQERGSLPYDAVHELLTQIGSALAFAHRRDVIHRDVKPSNILREADTGRWLLADFGVARGVRVGETAVTQTGMIVGTPGYMAPEQLLGTRTVDGRADLYSLAAVACEALAGQQFEQPNTVAEAERLLRLARPDLAAPVVRALTAPLAFDRDQRPPTVEAWLKSLEQSAVRRRSRWFVAAATVLLAATATWRLVTERDPVEWRARTVVILPFAVDGTEGSTELAATLARTVEDQLRWLPNYRIVGSAAVTRSIAARHDPLAAPPDSLLQRLARSFDVDEVVWGRGSVGPARKLDLALHVRQVPGNVVRTTTVSGPVDSLGSLVSTLVTQAFAERVAMEQTGWSAAMPRGLAAVRTYLEADAAFRRGDYDEALALFEDVIERDPSFAPAHFKRMLCEVIRSQPTRASDALGSALAEARQFRAGLDPATRDLLEGYRLLVEQGELERALDAFEAVTLRNPTAVDAWFILGWVQFEFGPLLGTPRTAAQRALSRAYELDPGFAAVVGLRAQVAILQDNDAAARRYLAEYVGIDSASVWSEAARMVDSLLYGSLRARLGVLRSFPERPTETLELIAFGVGNLHAAPADRVIAHDAIDALWRRAATPNELATAFRLRMASLLGTGRVASADTLLREGRRRNVRSAELDAWTLLTPVTGLASLADSSHQARAAHRLIADRPDDPTALWLVARWARGRDARLATEAERRLQTLAEDPTAPLLARSLRNDLTAMTRLAAADTQEAMRIWGAALRRYEIEQVPFGLVGSLWPLRLDRARVAAALGDLDLVLAISESFEEMAGFIDQVAWIAMLPLRAYAFETAGDTWSASDTYRVLASLLENANGPPQAQRDSVMRWLEARRARALP